MSFLAATLSSHLCTLAPAAASFGCTRVPASDLVSVAARREMKAWVAAHQTRCMDPARAEQQRAAAKQQEALSEERRALAEQQQALARWLKAQEQATTARQLEAVAPQLAASKQPASQDAAKRRGAPQFADENRSSNRCGGLVGSGCMLLMPRPSSCS